MIDEAGATPAPAPGLLRLGTPQALDMAFAMISLTLFVSYHVWYYSWHLWPMNGGVYRRIDMTGQTARTLFTQVGAPGLPAANTACYPVDV